MHNSPDTIVFSQAEFIQALNSGAEHILVCDCRVKCRELGNIMLSGIGDASVETEIAPDPRQVYGIRVTAPGWEEEKSPCIAKKLRKKIDSLRASSARGSYRGSFRTGSFRGSYSAGSYRFGLFGGSFNRGSFRAGSFRGGSYSGSYRHRWEWEWEWEYGRGGSFRGGSFRGILRGSFRGSFRAGSFRSGSFRGGSYRDGSFRLRKCPFPTHFEGPYSELLDELFKEIAYSQIGGYGIDLI